MAGDTCSESQHFTPVLAACCADRSEFAGAGAAGNLRRTACRPDRDRRCGVDDRDAGGTAAAQTDVEAGCCHSAKLSLLTMTWLNMPCYNAHAILMECYA